MGFVIIRRLINYIKAKLFSQIKVFYAEISFMVSLYSFSQMNNLYVGTSLKYLSAKLGHPVYKHSRRTYLQNLFPYPNHIKHSLLTKGFIISVIAKGIVV